MTLQEIYDKVFMELLEQGCASTDPFDGFCYYRTHSESGKVLKCAAGWLIPDELYDDKVENISVSDAYAEHPGVFSYVFEGPGGERKLELAKALQNSHDHHLSRYGKHAWLEEMLAIGKRFSLNTNDVWRAFDDTSRNL